MARTTAARQAATSNAERARARAGAAATASTRKAPKAPTGLGEAGKEAWTLVWTQCPWISDEHALVVRRLAEAYDDRADLKAELKKSGHMVKGSMGQPVESPLLGSIRAAEVSINRIERQLGIAVLASRAAVVADEVLAEQAKSNTGIRLLDAGR